MERTFTSIAFQAPCHGQRPVPSPGCSEPVQPGRGDATPGLVTAPGALGSGAPPTQGCPKCPRQRARQKVVTPLPPRRTTHPAGSGCRSRGCPSSSRSAQLGPRHWARLGPRPGPARLGGAGGCAEGWAGRREGGGPAARPGPPGPSAHTPGPAPLRARLMPAAAPGTAGCRPPSSPCSAEGPLPCFEKLFHAY